MALILGVVEGDKIFIDDKPLVVRKIDGLSSILITFGGIDYPISDVESVEISPEVFVSCGVPRDVHRRTEMVARLAFEAPRRIRIERRQVYVGKKAR